MSVRYVPPGAPPDPNATASITPTGSAVYVLDEQQCRDVIAHRAMRDWWVLRNLVVRSERAVRRG